MSQVFIQKFNPLSGQMEWGYQHEQYDHWQAIARSGYADMVNDWHRNRLYHQAIRKSVEAIKKSGRQVRALDIGTGTGLLSMMCARSGADSVTACECFEPMADCARLVIDRNGLADRISVVAKRSDELRVGEDVPVKANLLVAELFDTELIGEGALPTYRHAVDNLLEPGCLAVPARGRILIQLVESSKINHWHQFAKDIAGVTPPKSVWSCQGSNQLHDIQMGQLKESRDFRVITQPKTIFEFDFTNKETMKPDEQKLVELEAIKDVEEPIAVFMWWELDMDSEGEIVLSCCPWPCQTNRGDEVPWRDHWMQAIYYLPANATFKTIRRHDTIKINCFHDDYSLWFDYFHDLNNIEASSAPATCTCGLHRSLSRPRLGLLNDAQRLKQYEKALNQFLNQHDGQNLTVAFFGDHSLVPIVAAKKNRIFTVLCLSRDRQARNFWLDFASANDCRDKIEIIDKVSDIQQPIDLIIGEPIFNASDLPWHNLHFWHLVLGVDSRYRKLATIMPRTTTVKCMPVDFDHLWKIRSEVGADVEGFDLTPFDELIRKAASKSDKLIETHFLWEYAGVSLQEPRTVFEFDLTKTMDEFDTPFNAIEFELSSSKKYFGLVFWLDYQLNDSISVSGGPRKPPMVGEYIDWERNQKQAVAFVKTAADNKYSVAFEFDKKNGEVVLQVNEPAS